MKINRNEKRKGKLNHKHNLIGWLLILPAVLAFILVVWRPIGIAFLDSFFKIRGVTRVSFVGFKNYIAVLSDTNFLKSLMNTIKYVFWSLVIGLPLPFFAAIIINETVRTKRFFNVAVYIPCVIPSMATYLIWKFIYSNSQGGLLNMILCFFGLQPMTWLNNANLSIPLIIVMLTWSGFGGAVIMYLASLQGIDRSLYEAAKLDGAGIFQRIRVVMMPHMWGILLLQAVRQIIGIFQIAEQPLVMTGGGPNGASTSLGLTNYYYAFKYGQFDRSMALGVIMFVLLVWLTLLYFRLDKKINE